MKIKVNPSLATPIYAQIADSVRSLIMVGELKADDMLPSVRSLANKLEVNALTVQKAYKVLEAEGLVKVRRGMGVFVCNISLSSQSDVVTKKLTPVVDFVQKLDWELACFLTLVEECWNSNHDKNA